MPASTRLGKPQIRIGDLYFRLAEGWAKANGVRAFRRLWQSPNIGQTSTTTTTTTVSGTASSSQTTNTQDIWWVSDSWAAGEGQTKMTAGDSVSETRFAQSSRIDLSNPGQMQLAKDMQQVGLGSSTPSLLTTQTTVEGSAFADVSGSSTAVGNDRRLNHDNDIINYSVALQAGVHQVSFYGYAAGPVVLEGLLANWHLKSGLLAQVSADNVRLRHGSDPDGVMDSDSVTFGDAQIEARFSVKAVLNGQPSGQAQVRCSVRRADNDNLVATDVKTLTSGANDFSDIRITFTAQAGVNYYYRVRLESDTGKGVVLDKVESRYLSGVNLNWSVRQGGTTLQNGTGDVAGKTGSVLLATTSFNLASPQTVEFRFIRQAVGENVFADKVVFSDTIAGPPTGVGQINPAWDMELGQGGSIWMVDHSAGLPVAYTWDQANRVWKQVATFGVSGATVRQMASSDQAEYVLLSNGHVYKIQPNGSVLTYTANPISNAVGLAVAASRLWVLAESSGSGDKLYRLALDASGPQAVTDVTFSGMPTAGQAPDTTMKRRMAGFTGGPAFFVNRSTTCDVFTYDDPNSLGKTYSTLPQGFVARSIIFGNSFIFIGGQFPATGGGTRPAVFLIDQSVGPGSLDQLGLTFARDGDPDTVLQDMQLYGQDLFVLTVAQSSSAVMRLWRVSLAAPGGLFLEQEVALESGAAGRALAVNGLIQMLTGDGSSPWVTATTFLAGADASLQSSTMDFGITGDKVLSSASLDGVFPSGTEAELMYSVNGGAFVSAGVWTAGGEKAVSNPGSTVTFRDVAWEVHLRTQDPNVTPLIYTVSLKALASSSSGSSSSSSPQTFTTTTTSVLSNPTSPNSYWELYLDLFNEQATSHMDGSQVPGAMGAQYLYGLAAAATHVNFEDRFSDPARILEFSATLDQCEVMLEGPGEGVARVRIIQRS